MENYAQDKYKRIGGGDLVLSPGKVRGAGKEISEALGRKPQSTDLNERHPFDVEICRILARQESLSLSLA